MHKELIISIVIVISIFALNYITQNYTDKTVIEVKEYLEDNNIEELADIVEVIYGILNSMNVSIQEFEEVRINKQERRGAFEKKIYLEETE